MRYLTTTFDPPSRKRKAKKVEPPKTEKSESIHYNCTVRVSKDHARMIFDDKAERCRMFTDLLAEASLKMWREEQLKSKAAKADSASMSSLLNQTNHNSLTSKELGDSKTKNTGQNGQIWRGITSLKPEFS